MSGPLQVIAVGFGPGAGFATQVLGEVDVVIDGVPHKIRSGDVFAVPAGAYHNVICTGDKPLKIYMIYGPPNHIDKLTQATKVEADTSEEAFDGAATATVLA